MGDFLGVIENISSEGEIPFDASMVSAANEAFAQEKGRPPLAEEMDEVLRRYLIDQRWSVLRGDQQQARLATGSYMLDSYLNVTWDNAQIVRGTETASAGTMSFAGSFTVVSLIDAAAFAALESEYVDLFHQEHPGLSLVMKRYSFTKTGDRLRVVALYGFE